MGTAILMGLATLILLLQNNMPKKPKPKHGGKRAGSGQKLKYGEPTTTVAFRVPISKRQEIRDLVAEKLEQWRKRG